MSLSHFLSVCVCVKNERRYLDEFVKHYLLQGADHIYIVNNGSTDGIEDWVERHDFRSSLTLLHDPRDLKILTANAGAEGHRTLLNDNMFERAREETEWLCVVDADEFMFGKNGHTIRSYLKTCVPGDVGCVYVLWNIINPPLPLQESFSLSDFQSQRRLNYDLFERMSPEVRNANDFGKSIVRTSMLSERHKLWIHKIQTTGKTVTNYYVEKPAGVYDNCSGVERSEEAYANLKITMNHYAIRNLADFDKKNGQIVAVDHKAVFIRGLFQMLELDAEMLVVDPDSPGRRLLF